MIFLDAGYLIAIAKPRDSLHARAVGWTSKILEPYVVTEFVLCETVDALSLPRDREKANTLIKLLRERMRCRVVEASTVLFEAGLNLHASRPDKEWSLTDCISFCVMQEHGIRQALAYDAHFEQAGFEALLRRDPP